ncbi:hypothetical protein GUJ93_ZPchr0006g41153 [Zizania palustris]|uniref:Knottins-like domain-containing protein n=1 Tax=Zizania palustris TaxID=103762 RepID=A0A8J5W1E6_ZIZPA|nr:hypothetical protein GUJ93_ZPchr0006g41153 [Zizania palustris]
MRSWDGSAPLRHRSHGAPPPTPSASAQASHGYAVGSELPRPTSHDSNTDPEASHGSAVGPEALHPSAPSFARLRLRHPTRLPLITAAMAACIFLLALVLPPCSGQRSGCTKLDRSKTFKGDCHSDGDCADACRSEGYTDGYCFTDVVVSPDRPFCMCVAQCPPPAGNDDEEDE